MPRSTPEKAASKRSPITTELLVDAAIELIESDGLDSLSMRRLADRFGIQAASVYWYVASKEHMLDLVVDRLLEMAYQAVFLENVEQRRTDDENWQQVMRRIAIAYRGFLLAHPDSARVIAGRLVVGPNLAVLLEPVLGIFRQAGMSPREAVHSVYVMLVYVQGFVLHETAPLSAAAAGPNDDRSTTLNQMQQALEALPAERYPYTREAAEALARPDLPARFTFGLDRLIAGLADYDKMPN
ncbi:MAG: TetR/AcrR family transcriptional regulator [Actinomycetota bacterium]|nr:TetR/AcrR family transcriptional regulator [Actinomycetota bacterium]MDQ2956455.1 TetR/AcrR family transcriptional regulator [Actinomycetota bacterium]